MSAWISVNDELPDPEEQDVLIYIKYHVIGSEGCDIGRYFYDGWATCNTPSYKYDKLKEEVTHWMPLPEPPNE